MSEIKTTLNKIEVKLEFNHVWFTPWKFVSFWDYYNKVSLENENPAEQQNIRRFYARQLVPLVPMTDGNRSNIEELS